MGINDTFSSLDTTNTWVTVTANSGTVSASNGKAVVSKPGQNDKAVLMAKAGAIAHGASSQVKALVDVSSLGSNDVQHRLLTLVRKSTAPASGDTINEGYMPLGIEAYNLSGTLYYRFRVYDSNSASQWWDFSPEGWTTTFDIATNGNGTWKAFPSGNNAQYTVVMEMSSVSGVRMLFKSADEATTHATTGFFAWASIGGSGTNYWPAFGGVQYTITSSAAWSSMTMNVDSVVSDDLYRPASPRVARQAVTRAATY